MKLSYLAYDKSFLELQKDYYIYYAKEYTFPSVISSINFSEGKHFSVIKIEFHVCGCIGIEILGFL